MGDVEGNWASGTVASGGGKMYPFDIKTITVSPGGLEPDRFENGRFESGVNSLRIDSNTADTITITNIGGTFSVPNNSSFFLYDDDDMDDDGSTPLNLNGDDGEDVDNNVDTSLLTSNSSNPANNLLAPAYIIPAYDLSGSNDDTVFILNMADAEIDDYMSNTNGNMFNNYPYEAKDDFWTIYLVNGYQGESAPGTPSSDDDGDPNNVPPSYGTSNVYLLRGNEGAGAIVFLEVGRPTEYPSGYSTRPVSRAHTIVHEVGHLFRGEHVDNGIMATSDIRNIGIFSDAYIFAVYIHYV